MERVDAFSGCHPLVNFIFFIGAVVFGMFFLHPAFLCCSLVCAAAYYVTVRGRRAWRLLCGALPLLVLIAAVNPLFNTGGDTVLFYVLHRPYTLEALYYGLALSAMFLSVLFWFAGYHCVMTTDKFLYLFGRAAPAVTLLLTMSLRLLPTYRRKLRQLSTARQCIGRSAAASGGGERMKNGALLLSALTSWALEGGIITADSMRNRGYGCARRTTYALYRFTRRDGALLLCLLVLAAGVLWCAFMGGAATSYTPRLALSPFSTPCTALGTLCYALFLLLPTALNVTEDITWHILRSRI